MSKTPVPFAPETLESIQRAFRQASDRRHDTVGLEHLLEGFDLLLVRHRGRVGGGAWPTTEAVARHRAFAQLARLFRPHPYLVVAPREGAAPFVAAVHSRRRVYAVLSAEDYAALAPRIGAATCVVERRPTFEIKLRQVLTRQPLPELLLITNRCGDP